MEVTREHAVKLLEVVDHGLTCGLGVAAPGEMCVEAAVSYALGLPHGDSPSCVSRDIRDFKIFLNDREEWPSRIARAKGMRRAAVAQLGSSNIVMYRWDAYLSELLIKAIVEPAITKAITKLGSTPPEFVVGEYDQSNHSIFHYRSAISECGLFDLYPLLSAVSTYPNVVVGKALNYNRRVGLKKISILKIAAECCVQACIKFETEGSQWLDLCPLEAE